MQKLLATKLATSLVEEVGLPGARSQRGAAGDTRPQCLIIKLKGLCALTYMLELSISLTFYLPGNNRATLLPDEPINISNGIPTPTAP